MQHAITRLVSSLQTRSTVVLTMHPAVQYTTSIVISQNSNSDPADPTPDHVVSRAQCAGISHPTR
jgi:hypothetical protein